MAIDGLTNLEQLQAVLLLSLLDHGDEPHDNVERKQDPTGPQQVYLPFQAKKETNVISQSIAHRNLKEASIDSLRWSRTTLLTVRRLKANWLAAPTVTTVTRCLSSRTIVNCRDSVKFRHEAMHCRGFSEV